MEIARERENRDSVDKRGLATPIIDRYAGLSTIASGLRVEMIILTWAS